jgi:hypothetical protein
MHYRARPVGAVIAVLPGVRGRALGAMRRANGRVRKRSCASNRTQVVISEEGVCGRALERSTADWMADDWRNYLAAAVLKSATSAADATAGRGQPAI